jgi:hypothetical protein
MRAACAILLSIQSEFSGYSVSFVQMEKNLEKPVSVLGKRTTQNFGDCTSKWRDHSEDNQIDSSSKQNCGPDFKVKSDAQCSTPECNHGECCKKQVQKKRNIKATDKIERPPQPTQISLFEKYMKEKGPELSTIEFLSGDDITKLMLTSKTMSKSIKPKDAKYVRNVQGLPDEDIENFEDLYRGQWIQKTENKIQEFDQGRILIAELESMREEGSARKYDTNSKSQDLFHSLKHKIEISLAIEAYEKTSLAIGSIGDTPRKWWNWQRIRDYPSLTTVTPDALHHALVGTYVLGNRDTNTCQGQGVQIASEVACHATARAMIEANEAKSWGQELYHAMQEKFPRGCFLSFGLVSYNPHTTGNGTKFAQPICRAEV